MELNSRVLVRMGLLGLMIAGLTACNDDDEDGVGPGQAGLAIVEGQISASRVWTADTTYVLRGFVQVTSGATLTIRPGTKIVGDTTRLGSSLFILPGAKLMAEGTAQQPIVFTSQRAQGFRKPGDWGGIVIVGRAQINRSIATALTEGPAEAAVNYAGGTDPNDNSGSLKYVRIEFAGYDVSGGGGQELNSLSMYAVGRGTSLQYVQTLAGLDDGFEWFGGSVDGQYLVSAEFGDDGFDWTEGYNGRNQFLVAYQSGRLTPATLAGQLGSDPRAFEGDGCEARTGSGCDANYLANQPLSSPVFANFTAVGSKAAGFPTGSDAVGLFLRRGTAGHFYNGIVANYNGFGLEVRDAATNTNRLENKLVLNGIAFVDNAAPFSTASSHAAFSTAANFPGVSLQTGTAASMFGSITQGAPNFSPTAQAQFAANGVTVPSALYQNYKYGWVNTSYMGAINPNGSGNWLSGWTNFAVN